MARVIQRIGGSLARRRDVMDIEAELESRRVAHANQTTGGTFPRDRWREQGRYRGPFAWSLKPGAQKVIKIGAGVIRLGNAQALWATDLQGSGTWPVASADEYDFSGLAAGDYALCMHMDIDTTTGLFTATYKPYLDAIAYNGSLPLNVMAGGVLEWPIMSFTITAAIGLSKPQQRWHGDIIYPTAKAATTSGYTWSITNEFVPAA